MKKTFIFGMVLIVMMMICVSSAAAQDTVTRDLPDSADANTTITVNLTVDVETTAGSLLIDEVVPSGWTVVSTTNDGDYATLAGHIYWTKLSSVTDATYSYTIQIPADASGTYTFNGTYMFDWMTTEAIIPGDTELTVGAELPKLVSCVIDPTPPVVQGTNITVDCLFSETVAYEIRVENATGDLVEEIGSGTAKNPKEKWWNTTTETPAGIYTVNVTMDNATSGMSAYNNTNTIEVTQEDTTAPVITDVTCDTPTTDSVNITWTTDEDSDSLVKYGTTSGAYTDSTYDATMVMSHSITLTGLDADTTYYFVVNSTDASDNSGERDEGSFRTASAAAQDTVTRDLPESADADTTITVNLTVDVETTAGSLLIDEVVPSGWTVVSTTNDGDYATLAGHIYWTKLSNVTDATYSYTIQIPADASGTYTFNGTYMFDWMTTEAIIPGDTELTVGAELPKLVSCVIEPIPPVVQSTNVSIDCLFSETVDYEIRIENATGDLVEMISDGTAKNPDPKWWNTTTETPAGIYTVNVTMYNSTSGLSSYNDTNTIEVTQEDTTPPYTSDHDPAPDATGVPIDTDVTVHVLDDGDGVNESTIVMTVDGAVVTPDITGTSADYTLIYNPPADFTYDQLVNVTIDAFDLAGNAMHDAYSFTAVNASITITIDDAIASTGGDDDVTPVLINNVVNVGVVRIDIHYDPSVVWVVDVADGDFDFIISSIDNAAGVVRIGAMQVVSSGLNGDVLLAEVTLQAKGGPGNTSALSIDIKELKDATPKCNPIQTGVEDGIFTVSCLCGDVNEDGNVLLDDAMYLVKHCVKEPGFEQINECASDVNCDGAIEMADAMYLAKHCVGVQGFEKLHCCAGQQ